MRLRSLAPLLALVSLASCRVDADQVVPLYIENLGAPAQVAPGTALHLVVRAQSGGCTRYDHLEMERTPSRVTLRAWGIDASWPNQACTADIRYNDVPLDVAPPFTDPVTVAAVQPDGTILSATVAVR